VKFVFFSCKYYILSRVDLIPHVIKSLSLMMVADGADPSGRPLQQFLAEERKQVVKRASIPGLSSQV
jgi:hypothetical protein